MSSLISCGIISKKKVIEWISSMPKPITDPTYVGSKAYVNYIKVLKKKYRGSNIYETLDSKIRGLGSV